MKNKENIDLLLSVIPRLTQLTTVRYIGGFMYEDADRAAVAAFMSLTQLVRVWLEEVDLADDGIDVTDIKQLQMVRLGPVYMSARSWGRFVSSLLTVPQSVCVILRDTDIDRETRRRIQTSPYLTVTKDDEREQDGHGLVFTTSPYST